jgi:LmbE family N-acetylglucosaminyl deacetylase
MNDGGSFLDNVSRDAVIVFVGAHPDDETTLSPLLAYCARRCREVVVVSLTRGQAGCNLGRADLTRTLAEVRTAELAAATQILGCTSLTYEYINGLSTAHPGGLAVLEPLDAARARWQAIDHNGQTPTMHYDRWTAEAGDPAERLLGLLRDKRPAAVIALEIENGFTDHPEHITATLAARNALAAYNRQARRPAALYYAYPNDRPVEGAETITTEQLNRLGAEDYGAIAWQAWRCYESQYGLNDGPKRDQHMRGFVTASRLKRIETP